MSISLDDLHGAIFANESFKDFVTCICKKFSAVSDFFGGFFSTSECVSGWVGETHSHVLRKRGFMEYPGYLRATLQYFIAFLPCVPGAFVF